MTRVRWFEDTGFEGQCAACGSWWPLDREFWAVYRSRSQVRRCRDCYNQGITHRSEARRRYNREWMRTYRARHRLRLVEKAA